MSWKGDGKGSGEEGREGMGTVGRKKGKDSIAFTKIQYIRH